MRVKGHKRLELRSAGERKRSENSWTWICECGAQESASTKQETLREWKWHLQAVASAANPAASKTMNSSNNRHSWDSSLSRLPGGRADRET